MKPLRQEILSLLKKQNRIFWNLAKHLSYSLSDLIKELNLLHKEKIIETKNNKISLTSKGKKLTENLLIPINWNKAYSNKLLKKFLKEIKNRPKALQKFDQGVILPKDTIQRTIVMGERQDIDRKNILIIGDDDLVSVSIALTKRAKSITVLEIDSRINSFINSFAKKNNFPLKALTWDVRKPLSVKFKKKFDVFLTDPVETISGIKMFLGRGMESLKENSVFYFGLTNIDCGHKKWLEIQKLILNSGFIFTDIIKDQAFYDFKQFEKYDFGANDIPKKLRNFPIPSAKETYFSSNFIRCFAVNKIKPLVKGKTKINKSFYHDADVF